jgi:DNA-binding beta-propeller fold protein YncE
MSFLSKLFGRQAKVGRGAVPSERAVDRAGALFITHHSEVSRVSPTGMIAKVGGSIVKGDEGDGGPAAQAKLIFPEGLALDDAGSLYIADSGGHRVRRISPDGIITTVAGNGVLGCSGDGGPATKAQLFRPRGVAVDSDGNLFIADSCNNRIRKVSLDGVITTVAGTKPDYPTLARARRRAGSCRPPPACPRAATLASAPTRKCDHNGAEQPIAAENRRLTHPTDPTTITFA